MFHHYVEISYLSFVEFKYNKKSPLILIQLFCIYYSNFSIQM
jgi:hypothetical protein